MVAGVIPNFWQSLKVAWRVIWRAVRQTFHEATGALFFLFATYGALAAWRQWHHRPAAWLIGFAIAYAVLMLVFGFTAFRRARRVR